MQSEGAVRGWMLAIALFAGGATASAQPFDCGVRPIESPHAVPKNAPPGVAPPEFTRSAVALPPLLWLSGDRTFLEIALLYWRTEDPDANSRFRLALPLLLDDCTPRGRTFLTPVYGWRRDSDGVAGYVLNYYYRRDARRDANVLFPLYWRLRTFRDDGSVLSSTFGIPPLLLRTEDDGLVTWISPLGYARSGRDRWAAALWPLYFGGASPDGSYAVVPPLLTLWLRDPDSRTLLVGPFFDQQTREQRIDALVPLWFYRHTKDDTFTLIPPLLTLYAADPTTVTSIVGPAYWHAQQDGWDAGFAPLAFVGRHRDSRYTVLPPLAFVDVRDGASATTIAGPAYWHARSDGWDAGFVPVGFIARHRDSAYTVLPPLGFVDVRDAEGSFTMAALLWLHGRQADGEHWTLVPSLALYHTGDGITETTVVGPGYWRRHPAGWDLGIVPAAFIGRHVDSAYTLIPPLVLDAHEGKRHFTIVPPLLYARAGDGVHEFALVGPLYGWTNADAEHSGFLPLWLHGRWRDGDHYTIVPPALFVQAGGARSETTVVGPAYYHEHPGGWDAGVVPAAFFGRHGDSRYTLLPALLSLDVRDADSSTTILAPLATVHVREGESNTTVVGPAYYHEHPGGWDAGLLPAAFIGRHRDSSYTLLPALLTFDVRDRESATTIVGPGYYHEHADGWDAGLLPAAFVGRHRDSSYTLLPALLTFDVRDRESATTVVGPGYLYQHADGWDAGLLPGIFVGRHADSRYTLVPPLLLDWRDREQSTTIAGPYYVHHDALADHTGVMFLYHAGHFADGTHYRVIPPALYLHLGDAESETTFVGPGYYHEHADGWDAGLAPVAFVGRHEQSQYTLVAPPLFMDFRDAESRFTLAGPVYHRSTPDGWDAGLAPVAFVGRHAQSQYTLVAPPVFMDFRDADHSTTLAGPVYVRRAPADTSVAVLPLAYYRGTADSTRLTVFPLLHYSATQQSSTTVAPLFYHDHDPGSTRTMLFPFYWDAHDAGGSSRVVFPFYWDFANARDDWRFTLAPPLWVRYRKGETETNIVGPIAWSWGRTAQGPSWSFHLFPAFSVESARPDHVKWRAMYGLVGRERSGAWHRWQVFYAWTDPTT